MDPLSISATVISLAAKCMQTAKFLHDLRGKYKYAEITIRAICSESMIIGATLSKLQTLMVEHPEILTERMQPQSQVENIFDVVLTGCMVVYSVLDEEVQRFLPDADNSSQISFLTKTKYIWDEDTMQSLLRDIRGQQAALTALIQLLQLASIIEMQKQIKADETTFSNVARSTRRLRSTRASTRDMMSIYDTTFDTQRRIVRGDVSMISSTEFTFDDDIVNSTVYRRALLAISRDGSQDSTLPGDVGPQEEVNKSSESTRTVKQDDSSSITTIGSTAVKATESVSALESQAGTTTAGTQTATLSDSDVLGRYISGTSDVWEYLMKWGATEQSIHSYIAKSHFSYLELCYTMADIFLHLHTWLCPESELLKQHHLLLVKYSKVKRYYFEVEALKEQVLKQLDVMKAVINYDWSQAPALTHTAFTQGEAYDFFQIRLYAPGVQQGWIPMVVRSSELVKDVVKRLSDKLEIDLDGWSLCWPNRVLPVETRMIETWPEGQFTLPLVSLRPVPETSAAGTNHAEPETKSVKIIAGLHEVD